MKNYHKSEEYGVLAPGADIYLMGICGTGMAALAGLLKEKGFKVRGSDSASYPPMGKLLHDLGIPFSIGYDEKNLEPPPQLVVIGNVITKKNPEARYVLTHSIPHISFPHAMADFFLKDRTSLVVAGTHGKTTVSSMLTSVLDKAGLDPGFMIGGILKEYKAGFRAGSPPYFVMEGDEYDTAFFDKSPKFLHYRPEAAILTSIEYDHADIYPDLESVKSAFFNFVSIIPEHGTLVACRDWELVDEAAWKAKCRVVTYGKSRDSMWRLVSHNITPSGTEFEVMKGGSFWGQAFVPLPGRHNALNALSVIALSHTLGLEKDKILSGISSFKGVMRRQEERGEAGGVTVIDDFAHHPTSVGVTLEAIKEKYDGRRLIAVFEPRTNTSRRRVFQEVYPASFSHADVILIREVPDPEKAPPGDLFSVEKLAEDLRKMGKPAEFYPDATAIINKLLSICRKGDVVAVLSNGAFENIHERLIEALKGKGRDI